MTWEEALKANVTYLGSYEILKLLSPRMFLEQMQDIVGGEITGTHGKSGAHFTLHFPEGYLKVMNKGRGEYYINLNGAVITSGFNLEKLKTTVIEELKK